MARSVRPTNDPPFFAEPWPRDPPIEAHYAPTITADPASQAQGMAAQLRTLAGIVEAPTICADEIKPRVTDAKCVRIPANGSPMVVRVAFLPPIHGGDLDCADPPLAPDPLLLHDPGIW